MADTKISALTAATVLDGTELLTLVQGGVNKKMAASTALAALNITGTNTGDQTSVTGNAGTATALATGRTLGISGDLTWTSPSFTGSGNVTAAGTLATVNSNVGSFGSATQALVATFNAKGLATAASAVTITPAVGSITGLGTGIATALAINTGSAGAPALTGGALGTPSSGNLSNCTALPVGSVTGFGTGIATWLATPSSANLASAITDETGTGALVFNPMTTGGDLIYGGASGIVTRLANGSSGQYLQSNGTTVAPSWATPLAINAMTDTWTSSGTTYSAIKMLVTDTASATNSMVLDLRAGASGTTVVFQVNKIGAFQLPGPFTVQFPDSTATGGNARGTGAVDLQFSRSAATMVASGNYSFLAGHAASATALYAIAMGDASAASAQGAIAMGGGNASGTRAIAFGSIAAASGTDAVSFNSTGNANFCFVSGQYATARSVIGARAHSSQYFTSGGDGQFADYMLMRITTDNTAGVVLTTNNAAAGTTNQVTLPNNAAYKFTIDIIARRTDSADYGAWKVEGTVVRDTNAAGTAIAGTPVTTTFTTPAGAWAAPVVSADTTNGCLKVAVTGANSQTIRWVARVNTVEVVN